MVLAEAQDPRLTALLVEAGFKIETMTYWNLTLLPIVTAVRWASRSRARHPEVRSDLALPASFMNTFLSRVAQFEFALSRHRPLPFGTSLFAIARK